MASRFASTRGFYGDGPRNLELVSDDKDDTGAATPSPNFRTTPAGGYLPSTNLTCTRHASKEVLPWNRVSNLEHTGPETETLSPGHRGLIRILTTS
ncbi:hypothetical protein AVEN_17161-1 [Araneus ventricosus]|nr:hypothetical protein AVEN_17161-1 [Araneus ventricosus]